VTRHSVMTPWADAPLKRFVDEARCQLAVLMQTSGQVLAQVGFQRSIDVQTACALSAAINASADHLGQMVDGSPFRGLHYAGRAKQIYIAQLNLREGLLVLLVVFDEESSLGIIQLYLNELRSGLAAAAPAPQAAKPALAEDFEGELNRNLASLFGKRA
jgi:predicted regulator of Ras-like GTPase activity (Roadblock/LC7/MglB family)